MAWAVGWAARKGCGRAAFGAEWSQMIGVAITLIGRKPEVGFLVCQNANLAVLFDHPLQSCNPYSTGVPPLVRSATWAESGVLRSFF